MACFHSGLRGICSPWMGLPSIVGLRYLMSWLLLVAMIFLEVSSSRMSFIFMFLLAWKSCWLICATCSNSVSEFCSSTDRIFSFFFSASFSSLY